MKILFVKFWYFAGTEIYCLTIKTGIVLFLMCVNLNLAIPVSGQDISFKNPSLEGTPEEGCVPAGWYKSEKSPDTHPGACCGITMAASDGASYIGAIAGSQWEEGVGQELETPLRKGNTYVLNVDLAFPPVYYDARICSANFAIYGGISSTTKTELLAKTSSFKDTSWVRYTFYLTPSQDYNYLIIGPYYDSKCEGYSAVLIDHFSAALRQVPFIKLSSKNTCKGTNNGTATVSVIGGQAPYNYTWIPGNKSGDSIGNLRSGKYAVTVTSSSGVSTSDTFSIREYEIEGKAIVTSLTCAENNSGEIFLMADGGVSPYMYSIDGGRNYYTDSVFPSLKAGTYKIIIKDADQCKTNLGDIVMKQPTPLVISSIRTTAISCSSVTDGELKITATGGTPPYIYSLPGYASSQQDSVFKKLDIGNYTYEVTDRNNCTVSGNVDIEKEWRDCAILVPTAFSPNGDGQNDTFRAVVHNEVTDFSLSVYGRWGELIFTSKNTGQGWNGMFKGYQMPAGSYVYIVLYKDSKGQALKQTGNLVLIR